MSREAKPYARNRRLGCYCEMNGEDVYAKFDADVYAFSPTNGAVEVSYDLKPSRSGFDVWNTRFGEHGLEVGFYVGGNGKSDLKQNVNGLIRAARQCTLVHGSDVNYEFDCVLTGFSVESTGVEWYDDVVLTFAAVRRGKLQNEVRSSTRSLTFYNYGTSESGLKVTLTSTSALSKATMTYESADGLKTVNVSNLKANTPFVIDGIEGKVLENGINSFLKTDLVSFPKAMPGENTISVSSSMKVEVEFYPTYEI